MIRLRSSSLTVLLESGGSFTDFTDDMWTYQRDPSTLTINSTDKLYIGFEKPITAFYPWMTTFSSVANAMTVKYFNGAFVDVKGFYDGTKGLTRNGFVAWEVNQDITEPDRFTLNTDQVANTINGMERFWYEVTFSMTTSQIIMSGLNLIFSDTEDLKLSFPDVSTLISRVTPNGNEIMVYEAVRIEIIKHLRSTMLGFKYDLTRDLRVEPINQWDILNIERINDAARFLSLSKFYYLASTEPGDIWWVKSQDFEKRYQAAVDNAILTIDYQDDGRDQGYNENQIPGHITLERD